MIRWNDVVSVPVLGSVFKFLAKFGSYNRNRWVLKNLENDYFGFRFFHTY